jgi:hypothetical protein
VAGNPESVDCFLYLLFLVLFTLVVFGAQVASPRAPY